MLHLPDTYIVRSDLFKTVPNWNKVVPLMREVNAFVILNIGAIWDKVQVLEFTASNVNDVAEACLLSLTRHPGEKLRIRHEPNLGWRYVKERPTDPITYDLYYKETPHFGIWHNVPEAR